MGAERTRLVRLEACAEVVEGARRLAAALEEADREATLLRVEQPLAGGDPLSWLRAYPGLPRLYWSNRAGDFELAGVGTAAEVEGPDLGVVEGLLASLPEGEAAAHMQVIGTARFDAGREVAAEWASFRRAAARLPLLECRRQGEGHLLAVNLRVAPDAPADRREAQRRTACKALRSGAPVLRTVPPAGPAGEDDDSAAWSARVRELLAAIARDDLQKAVLARRRSHGHDRDPLDALDALRRAQPAAYHFLVQPTPAEAFLGASPERLYLRRGLLLETEALAGTRARPDDPEQDGAVARELLDSAKDRAEHELVRAHLHRHLAPLAENLEEDPGPEPYKLAGLVHLLTRVHGRLREDVGDAALLAALHPTPAVCGTPTETARERLRAAEPFDRGLYAGPVGCFGKGWSEVAVALRCALLRGHWVQLFAGAGIVEGSDPDAEWQETVDKMRILEQALGAHDVP
jgi:menaquinone-specific isochorismate synthase